MINNELKIGNLKVGKNHPPLIVPEIGINHNGNLNVAIKMVDAAKKSGAKIIKHQTHIPEDEMSIEAKKVKPGNSKKNIFSIIKNCSLSEEDEFKLFKYVKSKNMVFISTPFSKKAVDRLIKFGVNAFKIGSGEFNNIPLLQYITRFKKPLILSTGMNDLKRTKEIYKFLKKRGSKFAFLHTTSLYPTPDKLVRLNSINEMRKAFPKLVLGYSDHTVCLNACMSAMSIGASIIEKHFTDSKKRNGPDIICSMDPSELKELIIKSNKIYNQLRGSKDHLHQEEVTRKFAFVSVVSDKEIKKGEKFSKENLWVRRPGNGAFKQEDLKFLYGKKASKKIPANIQIKRNHIA